MTALNSSFAAKLGAMTSTFMQMGHDIITAQQMAHISMYKQLLQQSTLCAFMSAYRTYAIIVILVLPLVFLLKKVKYN